MTQTESESRNNLASKQHQDSLAKVLKNDSSEADDTSNDDGLLSAYKVADDTSRKGRGENSNGGGGVEDLLIVSCDNPGLTSLVSELFGKGSNGEEFSRHGHFITKVDGKKVDDQTLTVSFDKNTRFLVVVTYRTSRRVGSPKSRARRGSRWPC